MSKNEYVFLSVLEDGFNNWSFSRILVQNICIFWPSDALTRAVLNRICQKTFLDMSCIHGQAIQANVKNSYMLFHMRYKPGISRKLHAAKRSITSESFDSRMRQDMYSQISFGR